MSGLIFIRDLAVVMITAGAAAWLCRRLGLSAIVGYLVAGAVIGPYTPPFALVADLARVQTLAQVGLVFLIFSIGLDLSLSRLRRLGLSTAVATAVASLLVLNGGRLFGWALGWSELASLVLAAMLMVSSSAIVSRVLEECKRTHERSGQLALGMTVLEDGVAVLMLTLLTSLIQWGGTRQPSLLVTGGTLAGFVVLLAAVSLLVAPQLLSRLNREGLPEIRTLLVAGLLLSLAWLAFVAGYSLALGAFVFGAIVGSTRHKADIERVFEGLRQIFGAVFFVAMGMQVDFRLLLESWPLGVGVAALALVLRPFACTLGLVVVGNGSREAIQAGLSLAPLGEFSFLIAQLGVDSGVVTPSFYAVAVGASLLTSLAGPVLTRRAEAWSQRLDLAEPRWVRGWALFYHGSLSRLRHLGSASQLWQLTRGRVLQATLQIALVSALLVSARTLYSRVLSVAGRDLLFPGGTAMLFWSLFGLLLIGPLIALWRHGAGLAVLVAERATAGTPQEARVRPLLVGALRAVGAAVVLAWLLALLPSGGSLLGAAGGVLVVLGVITGVFRRRLVQTHARVQAELILQLKRASQSASASAWSSALPQPPDWDLDLDEVTLPSDTVHAGQTVAQLALRQRFGCSLIGIDRQGYGLANPGAATALYPLDKLLLLGTAVELGRARLELSRAAPLPDPSAGFEELTLETVAVPEACPLAGRTLSELDLIRRAGVQIGGIRRGGIRRLAPGGQDRFEAGDELLVLGTHAQIRTFRAWLETATPGPPAAG